MLFGLDLVNLLIRSSLSVLQIFQLTSVPLSREFRKTGKIVLTYFSFLWVCNFKVIEAIDLSFVTVMVKKGFAWNYYCC